jgi:hypothetical protein
VGTGVEVGAALGDALGAELGAAIGVALGEALGADWRIFTPLLHTSFFPDLMQVYLRPAEILVELSFEQLAPALTIAAEGDRTTTVKSRVEMVAPKIRFTQEG